MFAVLAGPVHAGKGVYLEPETFLAQVFEDQVPPPQAVWLTKDLRVAVEEILDERVPGLKVEYHRGGDLTAWILESIGKEKPITVGVTVRNGAIERLQVLEFREERGWEVRYPFFTDQFRGAALNGKQRLSHPIDGITGATLSVRALKRIARAALFLHSRVVDPTTSP